MFYGSPWEPDVHIQELCCYWGSVMGVGPAVAIPAAVKAAGLQINDVYLFQNYICYTTYED
jgi:hypothetical protein